MRFRILTLAVIGLGFLSTGCASLNSNVAFQYQPSLISVEKPLPKTAGFTLLTDNRPEKDRKYTKSIQDVPEKITAKLLEDFEKSRIFQDVHYPSRENDDWIISGKVNRFKWKLYDEFIAYIPYLNLVVLFGIPMAEAYGITDIQLEIKKRATGELLGTFSASAEVKNSYTIYNLKTGEMGAELAESLRGVVKKLKEDIVVQLK